MIYTSGIMATRINGLVQREWIEFTGRNKSGEKILIELTRCDVIGTIGKAWKAAGHVDKNMTDWISITVYATDEKNNCYGKYNPQHKYYTKEVHEKNYRYDRYGGVIEIVDVTKYNHGCTLDFEWVLPWTDENREKIINEVYRRAEF